MAPQKIIFLIINQKLYKFVIIEIIYLVFCYIGCEFNIFDKCEQSTEQRFRYELTDRNKITKYTESWRCKNFGQTKVIKFSKKLCRLKYFTFSQNKTTLIKNLQNLYKIFKFFDTI